MLENCGESSRAGSDPALEKSVENLPKASRDRKGVPLRQGQDKRQGYEVQVACRRIEFRIVLAIHKQKNLNHKPY